MLENKKNVFWQSLFITALFFLLGLVLGVYLEQIRTDNFNIAFSQSEISLYDSFALGKLVENDLASCSDLKEASIDFADRIYDEARSLERFDEKSQLTETTKNIHRKYDLLRTLLWMNAREIKEKCPLENMDSIVYLYIYDTEEISIKSEQIVWSRILSDLKQERGNEIILIPIAADSSLISLNSLVESFNIKDFPAIIINDEHVLFKINSIDDLKRYL